MVTSSTARTRIVKIGNSRGIRIPKGILDQLRLSGEVELEVQDGQLVVRSLESPRQDWDAQFQQMAHRQDDALLDNEISPTDWDRDEWTW